jgi:hypothetical protein
MALQRFFFWVLAAFLKFLNPLHSQKDFLDGGSAHRKASTYTRESTDKDEKHTNIHVLSVIRTYDPSVRTG